MFKKVLIIMLLAFSLNRYANAQVDVDVKAKQAILIDQATGRVLFEKNPDVKMPTSSMSKVMTIYMVFEALQDKRLSLTDEFRVSTRAYQMGGSRMFLDHNSLVPVMDLLRGIIIQSGNDASVALAEGLYGSEPAFADYMTSRAYEMGMTNTNFVNASGWPEPDHYSTVRDLAVLSKRLITDFPEYYYLFAEKNFTYNNIKQGNRNPLLYRNMGVDGIKTGHSEKAGYGLMASAERNGRRLIAVLNGMDSKQSRADEGAKLLEWGFRFFRSYDFVKANEVLGSAKVFLGLEEEVPFAAPSDIKITLSRAEYDKAKMVINMKDVVSAPITKGEQVATLTISAPNMEDKNFPLLATKDVEKAGFLKNLKTSIINLF